MKQLLLFTLMMFGFAICNAQGVVANSMIYDFYPASKIEIILKDNPEKIVYWNAIYKYGFEIKNVKQSQKALVSDYKEIEVEDLNKINILAMNLFPLRGENQYFKIKDSNKILTIFSEEIIKQKISKEK